MANLTLQIARAEAPVFVIEYPEDLTTNKYFAYELVYTTWSADQWGYFDDLITRESDWDSTAQNKTSSAFGLGQFLNGTWETVNCKKTTDPDTQISCTIKYIEKVYETPRQAIIFHNSKNWY